MEHQLRSVATPDGVALTAHVHVPEGVHPNAPTVVLAHGWGLSHASWDPVVDALAPVGVRVITWDQRGHGRSATGLRTDHLDDITIDHLGRDLGAVVRALVPPTSSIVLGGHAMGGMTVMSYAAQHPAETRARVRGVLLLATAAHDPRLGRDEGSGGLKRLVQRTEKLPAEPPIRGKGQQALLFGLVADPAHVQATRAQIAAVDPAVLKAFWGAVVRADVRAAFDLLGSARVSIIAGGRDKVTPPERSRAMTMALTHARYVSVATAGHMLPYEATDLVVDELRRLVMPGRPQPPQPLPVFPSGPGVHA